MKQNFDCKIYSNGKCVLTYTAKTFNGAFKYGASFYKKSLYNTAKKTFFHVEGFIITYESEVDELATIEFSSNKNYYYNTAEVGKLIKKYLPQLKNINPNQTELF